MANPVIKDGPITVEDVVRNAVKLLCNHRADDFLLESGGDRRPEDLQEWLRDNPDAIDDLFDTEDDG